MLNSENAHDFLPHARSGLCTVLGKPTYNSPRNEDGVKSLTGAPHSHHNSCNYFLRTAKLHSPDGGFVRRRGIKKGTMSCLVTNPTCMSACSMHTKHLGSKVCLALAFELENYARAI